MGEDVGLRKLELGARPALPEEVDGGGQGPPPRTRGGGGAKASPRWLCNHPPRADSPT